MSKIEWTEKSWNPVTGCTKISEGCKNCYAERMAKRLVGRFGYPKDYPFKVTFHIEKINDPSYWKKPKMIFVASMGDLFHPDVSIDRIDRIFRIISWNKQHIFQILTKRPDRALKYFNRSQYKEYFPLNNIWLGVSVENQISADARIPVLLQIPAAVRFVSCEPLLGFLDIQQYIRIYSAGPSLDWVIVGGETGSGARKLKERWVRSIKNQCEFVGVPFFFKQWNKKGDRQLDGRIWEAYPNEKDI